MADATSQSPTSPAPHQPLGRNAWALNFTSFFTDVGTEMIFPMLPGFLTGVLGASAQALGLIEGAADTVAAGLKLASGYVLDRWPHPKGIALFGYSLSSVLRPLVSLAVAPWQVLAIRTGDRVGKGLRGTAADALLAEAARDGESGRVFGANRAMDNLGALVGPLLATALLTLFAGDLRRVFFWAWVPGAFAVAALAFGVKTGRATPKAGVEQEIGQKALAPATSTEPLSRRFHAYLAVSGLFALASSSDAFLLLRAHEIGISQALIPTLWVTLNLVKAISAYPLGGVADRFGAAPTLVLGFLWYAASYAGFAWLPSPGAMWVLFPLYGVFYGLTEGVGKALVTQMTSKSRKGLAFGLYNAVTGLMALPAGLLTGVLWRRVDGATALWACAAISAVAAMLLGALAAGGKLRRGAA